MLSNSQRPKRNASSVWSTTDLNAVAAKMRSGLLPDEIEKQLNDIADSNLRAAIEGALSERLSQAEYKAFYGTGVFFDDGKFKGEVPHGVAKAGGRITHEDCVERARARLPLIPFAPLREVWRGFVTTGKSQFAKAEDCECNEVPFANIVSGAFSHKLAKKKDGFWFFPGKVEPVARANDNVRAIYGACIDNDDGAPAQEIVERAAAAGVALVIATSFSNGKTSTTVALSKAQELSAEGKSPAEILVQARGLRPEVAEGATLGEVVKMKGRDGKTVVEQVIHHKPCPKHRIFVPYEKPLLESDFNSHREFIAAHKRRYRAVAKLIGVENHDRACENAARIYYTARFPEGAPHFSIELPGRFLDPNDRELLALVSEDEKPVKKNKSSADNGPGAESGALVDGDFSFTRWAACGFADNFLVADALEARYPDGFYGGAGNQWRSICCPHDSHEQNGGTHVKNADPSAAKGMRGFSINCLHNTCAGEPVRNDRLAHLAKMVEIGWLTKSDLVARDFFAGSDAEHAGAMLRFLPQKLPAPFVRRSDGVYFVTPAPDDKRNATFERICGDFAVAGESKNEDGDDHSVIIEFASDDVWHRERISMAAIQGDAKSIRERLASMGLRIDGAPLAKARFDTLMSRLESDKRILTVSRPGFHEWQGSCIFVAPNGTAIDGNGARRDVSLSSAATIKNPLPRGSFGGWFDAMEAVAKSGNPHWIVGVCSGFAGPVVDLLGLPPTGCALIGDSSTGKSLGQGMGAGVWGDCDPERGRGLFRSARGTDNGLENRAVLAHGSLLAIDDLAHMEDGAVAKIIFTVAGGTSKERMNTDGSARNVKAWRTFYTFSAERAPSELIAAGGKTQLGGHAVRLPSILITGARIVPPDEMAAIESFKEHYGHAWQPFVERLFRLGYVADPAKLRALLNARIDLLSGDTARSTERRAAVPFALMWVAGEIARDAGALPMCMDIEKTISWAWYSYLTGAESQALAPELRVVNAVRKNLAVGWHVDVVPLETNAPPTSDVFQTTGAGDDNERRFKGPRFGWYDDKAIYVLKDALVALADNVTSQSAAAKILRDAGILKMNGDKLHHARLRRRGPVPHYVLNLSAILAEDQDEQV